MGFENWCEVGGAAATIQSPLNGFCKEDTVGVWCFVPFVVNFFSKTIKMVFLVDTGRTACTSEPQRRNLTRSLSPQDQHFASVPSTELISSITWKLISVLTTKTELEHFSGKNPSQCHDVLQMMTTQLIACFNIARVQCNSPF